MNINAQDWCMSQHFVEMLAKDLLINKLEIKKAEKDSLEKKRREDDNAGFYNVKESKKEGSTTICKTNKKSQKTILNNLITDVTYSESAFNITNIQNANTGVVAEYEINESNSKEAGSNTFNSEKKHAITRSIDQKKNIIHETDKNKKMETSFLSKQAKK
jgi:hypothetical protein